MNKTKKRKRKEIVNYYVREYAGRFTIANVILHRNNPIFKLSDGDIRTLLQDAGLSYFGNYIHPGNTKFLYNICKRKFRNLNYRIISWSDYDTTKGVMAEKARNVRATLLIKYIHLKRQEGQ